MNPRTYMLHARCGDSKGREGNTRLSTTSERCRIRFGIAHNRLSKSEICLKISVNGGAMGGFGSGRCWGSQTKGKVEHFAALDVRRLQRLGLLRPGPSFPQHWNRNGKPAASISVKAEIDRIIVSYERFIAGGEWQSERYPILLERARCNYGGQRAWFRCPRPGHRVAILYLDGIFACRHCHQLAYSSQRIAAWERALNQAQSIRERLGGTASMYDPFPGKPKRMHWRPTENFAGSMTTRMRIHGLAGFDGGRCLLASRLSPVRCRAGCMLDAPLEIL